MISGAESVKAMKPSLAVVTSGVSAAATGLGAALLFAAVDELAVEEGLVDELHPLIMNVAAVVAPAVNRKLRLEIFDMGSTFEGMNRVNGIKRTTLEFRIQS
jgi:hypothetical protein